MNQTVFDFSAIRRYQASKVAVEATKADNEGTHDQVTDQVARAYLAGLQRRKPRSKPQHANVDLSEALLRLAQQQKEAGTGTGIEITRAEVQLANDRQALLVAENDVDRTRLQLLKVIGLKLDNPVELTDQLQPTSPWTASTPRRRSPPRTSIAPSCARSERREENARLNFSATKFERLPSVERLRQLRRHRNQRLQRTAHAQRSEQRSKFRSSMAAAAMPAAPKALRYFARSPSAPPICAIKSNWMCASRSIACILPTRR